MLLGAQRIAAAVRRSWAVGTLAAVALAGALAAGLIVAAPGAAVAARGAAVAAGGAAARGVAPRGAAAAATATLSVGSTEVGPPVPAGFVGLATEYWNIENEVGTDPTKPDAPFEQAVRNLAPYGDLSLRIGGDSTDWTWWPIAGMKQPPWVRWTMTPTWAAVTKRLVGDLHAHVIIGINMEAASVKVASAEVHEIQSTIGRAAQITFELGNEPELYSHFPFYHDKAGAAVLGRPKSYSPAQMTSQWNQMAAALPKIRLAGPGYSGPSALPDVGPFLTASHRLKLLTMHSYPLKSTRCSAGPRPQEAQLFAPSSLQTLAAGLHSWASVANYYKVGVRVDEINSVTCGGQPGLSNSFGPALWALNILPLDAEAGINGVNFQSRPYTAQNLIQTLATHAGWRVRVQPEYYGLLAFAALTPPGSKLLTVSGMPAGVLAWAVRTPQGQTHVVITNVGTGATTVAARVPGAHGAATVEVLRSASGRLQATGGVTVGGQTVSATTGGLTGTPRTNSVRLAHGAYDVTVAPASAAIVSFPG